MRWRIVVWSLNSSRSSTWWARCSICSGLRSSPCATRAAAGPAHVHASARMRTAASAAAIDAFELRRTEVLGDAELEVEAFGAPPSIEVHERGGRRDEAHRDHRGAGAADHVADHAAA